MAGFHFYSSNRQEILMEALANLLQQPLTNALQPEHIVVQHYGMRRWVSMRLAERNRIEANTRYLSPHELLDVGFEQLIPGYQPNQIMEEEHLAWVLLEVLQKEKNHPQLAPVTDYLHDGNPLKAWQLAKRIAQIFGQYHEWLPEMIVSWEDGTEEHWQSTLWKLIALDIRQRHKSFLRQVFLDQNKKMLAPLAAPLERISVFGLFALPPLHVEILAGLAEVIEVHFFAFLPAEIELSQENQSVHPLVRSFGKSGNHFVELMRKKNLLTEAVLDTSYCPNHRVPEGNLLLEKIQRGFAKYTAPIEQPFHKEPLDPQDRSIQVHSCHTPMREVEVLHDQLLGLLDENASLNPDDILVMAPEIEEYVPFIHSVFSGSMGKEFSPFSIADRKVHPESKIATYLLELLRMEKSRYKLTEVLLFLESESIQKRFGLQETDLRLLKSWFSKVNIRWGIDPEFRQKKNLPPIRENTWEFGIDRLLTGYALPGEDRILFENVLPFDELEGNEALVLGNFLNFFEKLTALVGDGAASLLHQRSLGEWAEYLRGLLTDFFVQEAAWEEEWVLFWEVAEELENIEKDVGVEEKFAIEILVHSLEEKLNREFSQRGFLGHGITFSSMRPMRSIPFKVIALLGMNENAFPRRKNTISFDLMASHQNLGGHNLKEEGRYLFLETLLSCRKVLYISYIGQGVRDNAPMLPSIVVTELLDYIKQTYEVPKEHCIQHHLQAFHPDYFQKESALLSYSHDNWKVAQALVNPHPTPSVFEVHLPKPEATWMSIDIEQLIRFFSAPARFLFNQRLGVYLDQPNSLPIDEEPFLLDALQKYSLQTQQIEWLMEARDLDALWHIMKAQGTIPSEPAGSDLWKQISEESYEFFQTIKPYLEGVPLVPLRYDFSLEGVRLKGELRGIRDSGLIRFRPAKVKTKDRLQIWIEQLVRHLEPCNTHPLNAVLIGKQPQKANKQPQKANKKSEKSNIEIYTCPHIKNPQKYLSELLHLYKKGLQEPLAFFPETAEAYVKEWMGGDTKKAEQKADLQWFGNDYSQGEMNKNLYFKSCFEHQDLWKQTDFESIACSLLLPVLTHQQKTA